MKPRIIYIDMDDVLCDFSGRSAARKAQTPSIAYPQTQYDFFRSLEPLPDAIESVSYLKKHPQFDIYILTAPSVYNPMCYTEKRMWVEDHLGMDMVKRLIINPHKHLNKGDYLIDDHASGSGQDMFEGKLLHFGSPSFPNWKAVIAYFEQEYPL
ncbi:MAG: hypothetical protein AB8F95_10260 [Bacteroidia bacterium]